MQRVFRIAAAIASVALIAACAHKEQAGTTTVVTQQNAATTAPQSATHDPCALLTTSEVSLVLKKHVGSGKATDETHCMYGPIILEAAWSGADAQFSGGQAANSMMGDSEKTRKVGDASYSSAMGNMFYARKGDAYVGIDMRAAAVDVKTAGPTLAEKALARM
ncbi:MAG: hypothetical protein ABR584_09500 [Candidatus Baltobacteraceae bacterium]